MQFLKVVLLVVCFWLGNGFSQVGVAEAKEIQNPKLKVIVTAYYKPLLNQDDYVSGTYAGDIEMNGTGKKTSSGSAPKQGTLAADTDIFPKGTVFHIPGYGRGTVKDTGGSIKGQRLDLYMGEGDSGRKKAIAWGRKDVRVLIISKT